MRMRIGTILAALLVASCVLAEVTCITNQEFFDLVKDHVEDLESFDIDDPAINEDDDYDSNVIELPGNADDDLDIEYILTKLEMADVMEPIQENTPLTQNNNLGWYGRRRYGRRRYGRRRYRRRRYRPRRSCYRRSRRRSSRRRRSSLQNRMQNPCSCRGTSTNCCLIHTFQTNLGNNKWRFRVNGNNAVSLLEDLETIENKETGQFENDNEDSDE